MRSIRFSFAALLALFVFSLTAHAEQFLITQTIQNDGTQLFGTISFSGDTYSGSFTFFDGTTSYVFDAATSSQGNFSPPDGNYNITEIENVNGDLLELGGFSGPPSTVFDIVLCSTENLCTNGDSSTFVSEFTPGGGGDSVDISAGDVSLTENLVSTPEPSSLVLMGTGVLAFAGAARRKFLHC